MLTPADKVVSFIKETRYHNHRSEAHSDLVCEQFIADIIKRCPAIADDLFEGKIKYWLNEEVEGLTHKVDLLVCSVSGDECKPSLGRARICLENKSVITAHGKNRRNRFSDLADYMNVVQAQTPEAIILGHVLVGTATKYLNVPDMVKKHCQITGVDFEKEVLPRLSSGDSSLWDEFGKGAKVNSVEAPRKTIELMQSLAQRERGHTHEKGFDFLLVEPIFVDNINEPAVLRENSFELNIDAQYEEMLDRTCRAYTARWHTL